MAQGSGAAAGAAIGTAFAPGIGTAIGGFMGGFLDGGPGGSAGNVTPMDAQAAVYGSGLDGSGWNTNFAGVQTNGSNKAGGAQSAADALGIGAGGISPLLIVAVVVVVGAVAWSRSRK